MKTSDWLAARAAATPEKLALIINNKQWTYHQLDGLVSQMAAHLVKRGIRPGDFVAALLPNSLVYVCLVHALARLGAVLIPLNTRLTAAELQWQIDHIGCHWLITLEKAEGIMNCEQIIMKPEWQQMPVSTPIHQSQFNMHQLQAIVFTSGTSGQPKGVMLTFANHFWSAIASSYRLGIDPDDRWLSVLPLYHVGGLAVIFRSCLYGTAVILHQGFHLNQINHSLDNQQITLISLVPTMLYRLLQSREHWPASLRLILLGGAAATPELIEQANALPGNGIRPLVAPTYGLTEAASQVATMLPADAARKPGSVGKPLMFTAVKIIDNNDNELPLGEVGEIIVNGPTVMAGYFEPGKISSPLLPCSQRPKVAAPLHTGDMGYLDEDGDLWVVQRRSDLIVSGGENVYPAEVEKVLREHTAVSQVCVVGIPHPEWGQQVAAMVQIKPGQSVTEDELLTFSREQLAGYKQPRRIVFVDALPQTASGKIARREVANLMRDG
ncbi:MAG: o-succinylbenzoate--CoA ligase [Ardenticatenaceae bacterium]|nr:o-succinylbenzoate--CoA ligase [Ardenticatenaceae bacterium]MCB9444445.1 o-succinylbenzoate--CoA ligase [Ardenticatenaceae bacterium]